MEGEDISGLDVFISIMWSVPATLKVDKHFGECSHVLPYEVDSFLGIAPVTIVSLHVARNLFVLGVHFQAQTYVYPVARFFGISHEKYSRYFGYDSCWQTNKATNA
jgi:hypothetical protein